MGIKITPADKAFSYCVKFRDKWTCQRCGKKHEVGSKGLHCSHYWGRGKSATRRDLQNCISLCYPCHQLWGHGDGRDEYKLFMINQLGQRAFDLLEYCSHQPFKLDEKMDRIYWEAMLEKDYHYEI